MKNLGNVVLEELIKLDFKVPVNLEDEVNGPRQSPSPGEYSVMDILTRIFIGKPILFQAVLKRYHNKIIAFFSNINPLLISITEDISRDVGAWLKIYLLK